MTFLLGVLVGLTLVALVALVREAMRWMDDVR